MWLMILTGPTKNIQFRSNLENTSNVLPLLISVGSISVFRVAVTTCIILIKLYIFNYSSVCFINSLEFLAVRIFTTYISKNWYSFRKTWTIVFTLLYCLGEIVWLSESMQFLSVPWLHSQITRVLGNPLCCWRDNCKLNMENCVALEKQNFGKSLMDYELI